jgi:hypothetical protein
MDEYIVEIFRMENNSGPYRSVGTDQFRYTVDDLEPGSYYWRIRSMDDDGREAPVSATRSFTITTIPDLGRPDILSPADGTDVDMQYSDELVFSWEPVPMAEYYLIKFRDLKNDRTILEERFTGSRYVFSDLEELDVGDFIFEVQAVRENRDVNPPSVQTSDVVRSTFTIRLQDEYEEPNVISPDTQYTR